MRKIKIMRICVYAVLITLLALSVLMVNVRAETGSVDVGASTGDYTADASATVTVGESNFASVSAIVQIFQDGVQFAINSITATLSSNGYQVTSESNLPPGVTGDLSATQTETGVQAYAYLNYNDMFTYAGGEADYGNDPHASAIAVVAPGTLVKPIPPQPVEQGGFFGFTYGKCDVQRYYYLKSQMIKQGFSIDAALSLRNAGNFTLERYNITRLPYWMEHITWTEYKYDNFTEFEERWPFTNASSLCILPSE